MNSEYELVYDHVTKKTTFGHHLVLPKRRGYVVDHINGNKKDNRPENLRYLRHADNCVHRHSATAGIDFIYNRWRARYRSRHLGLFLSREEALNARRAALQADEETWR